MKLPIDTAGMTFLCAALPQPVVDFESKRPRVDENGQPLFAVQLVALADGGAEVISVKLAGAPAAVNQGQTVKPIELVATPWAMGDRSGISFRALRLEPAAPQPATSTSRNG